MVPQTEKCFLNFGIALKGKAYPINLSLKRRWMTYIVERIKLSGIFFVYKIWLSMFFINVLDTEPSWKVFSVINFFQIVFLRARKDLEFRYWRFYNERRQGRAKSMALLKTESYFLDHVCILFWYTATLQKWAGKAQIWKVPLRTR